MAISNPMTIIGLVNGMIGGIILVLPILALHTGYILIGPITIATGFISFFSCLLCLRHLNNYNDLDEAVLKHFNNNRKYQIAYDIIIAISMTVLLILYFTLICDQWIGITQQSILIPILNFVALIPIIFIMRKFDFGASLLAYGILSIIGYVIFLIWMLLTSQQGHEHIPPTGEGFSNLTAGLSQGFAIQTFFIPVLKKNNNRKHYKLFLIITYLIGTAIYLFIGYGGSFGLFYFNAGISNRVPATEDPDTIQDYFPNKNWEVIFIEVVYLIHLYSVFPEFLFIARKRVFNALQFKRTLGEDSISKKQILFYLLILLLCFGIQISGLRVTIIIQLNGAIISFFFIYVIPISLHVKCVYFSKKEQTIELNEQKHIEMAEVHPKQEPKQTGTSIINIEDMKDTQSQTKDQNSNTPTNPSQTDTTQKQITQCCDTQFYSSKHEKCQIIVIVLMVTFGIFTMVHTLSNI